tara:strand:- start:135 stop:338 length:204 start_codon:yes stop_codon:yes gene_type:complete
MKKAEVINKLTLLDAASYRISKLFNKEYPVREGSGFRLKLEVIYNELDIDSLVKLLETREPKNKQYF